MCSIHLAILQGCTTQYSFCTAAKQFRIYRSPNAILAQLKKLQIGVNTKIWPKNTGTVLGQNIPRQMPGLSDVVIFSELNLSKGKGKGHPRRGHEGRKGE